MKSIEPTPTTIARLARSRGPDRCAHSVRVRPIPKVQDQLDVVGEAATAALSQDEVPADGIRSAAPARAVREGKVVRINAKSGNPPIIHPIAAPNNASSTCCSKLIPTSNLPAYFRHGRNTDDHSRGPMARPAFKIRAGPIFPTLGDQVIDRVHQEANGISRPADFSASARTVCHNF